MNNNIFQNAPTADDSNYSMYRCDRNSCMPCSFDDLCYLHAHVIIEFEAVLRFGALYYYDCIALNFNF